MELGNPSANLLCIVPLDPGPEIYSRPIRAIEAYYWLREQVLHPSPPQFSICSNDIHIGVLWMIRKCAMEIWEKEHYL